MANDDSFTRSDWLRLIGAAAWLAVFVVRPQLVAAITLLAIGGGFIAYNAMIFWQTVVRKREAPSVAPIFGGIIAAAGIALLPLTGSWKWAWVPLLVDWGGLPVYLADWYQRRPK
jgi:hypothetical protein